MFAMLITNASVKAFAVCKNPLTSIKLQGGGYVNQNNDEKEVQCAWK